MSEATHLGALYSRPIILWVEDTLTSAYLTEIWENDPDIGILIAGGHAPIRAVVSGAQHDGYRHVFGLIDRDFEKSNYHQWLNPASGAMVFTLPVHEIENYLLEEDALTGCSLNTAHRTPVEANARLKQKAAEFLWWMACRRVLAEIKDTFQRDFPDHSSHDAINDRQSAEDHIIHSPWFTKLRRRTARVAAVRNTKKRLRAAYSAMNRHLSRGEWRREFAGKELFRHIRDWIYQPGQGQATQPSERDRDLAKAVARWQVAQSRRPPELDDLRSALRMKVGL